MPSRTRTRSRPKLRRNVTWRAPKAALGEDKAADPGEIGAAAVVLLGRRDFCSTELSQRLVEQGFDADAVATVIADLIEQRFVDDARYTSQFVDFHAARGHGPRRIRHDLEALGVPAAMVESALGESQDWHRLAREVRIRKFGLTVPAKWQEKARQARFLQYRGFSNDHIRSALGADLDLDS